MIVNKLIWGSLGMTFLIKLAIKTGFTVVNLQIVFIYV